MNEPRLLSPEEIAINLRGPMGLIIGPCATVGADFVSTLISTITTRLDIEPGDSLFSTGDKALEAGNSEDSIIDIIEDSIHNATSCPGLSTLSKARWSAVLSCCIDDYFEAYFRQSLERSVIRKPLRVVTDLLSADPGRVTPVYKLLGSIARRDITFCSSGHVLRKAYWRHAIQGFSERVKSNPVFCMGFEDYDSLLCDIIVEFLGNPKTVPSMILLLEEDVLWNNPHFRRVVTNRIRINSIRGSMSELSKQLSDTHRSGYPLQLPFQNDTEPLSSLGQFSELATVVNNAISDPVSTSERTLLLDLLFSPDVSRWDPYCHDLDFTRDVSDTLLKKMLGRVSEKSRTRGAIIVRGPAASGKTTILRRLSHDLAKKGCLVLWIKTSYLADATGLLASLCKELARLQEDYQVCIFVDDPFSSGSISIHDIFACSQESNLSAMVVIGVRDTEWLTTENSYIISGFNLLYECEIPTDISEHEWSSLPHYLVSIGAFGNLKEAEEEVSQNEHRSARDILNTLYYLLPQTKNKIRSAVRDEYVRLGDAASMQRIVLGGREHSAELLKDAYSFVSVADKYEVPVPIEVLVAALNVDYSAWLDVASETGPAWGVLYSFGSEEGECYRTRNALVTEFIVTEINGGRTRRSGEISYLLKMINACVSRTLPVYREFCARVLINNHVMESLDPHEGMHLYNAAIQALPFDDKSILHHRALWVKNKLHDPLQAIELLKECLHRSDYPYCSKKELNEHIHNSLAACYVDAINQGLMNIQDGKEGAFNHIQKARSDQIMNVNTVHTQANLSCTLLEKMPPEDEVDRFEIVSNSLSDIDNTLALIGRGVRPRSLEDIDFLEEARDRLFLALDNKGNIEDRANELWEKHKSQEGFAVHARRLLRKATQTNKGTDFNIAYKYCEEMIHRVRELDEPISAKLLGIALQIYYRWRIQRQVYVGSMPIEWESVYEMASEIIGIQGRLASPFYSYIRGLALAHIGDWAGSNIQFAKLRRLGLGKAYLWNRRDFLLEENGKARIVQGTLRSGVDRPIFYSEELMTDFPVDTAGKWNSEGEEDYAYIHFSFGGPTAIDRFAFNQGR